MELSDRLTGLSRQDQIRVMERVFQKLSLAFGNQILSKWQGIDMQAVYSDWAEELGGMSLGAIDHALRAAKELPHPPSQGEFKALCKTFKPSIPLMIESKLTPEQIERNRQKIADIAEMLARKKSA